MFSVFCALGGGKVFQMESSLRREKQPRQTKQPRSQIKGPNKKLTSFSDAMSLQKAQETQHKKLNIWKKEKRETENNVY